MRLDFALVTASFSALSRESTMFCLSSSDNAFCLSRYSASPRSLSSTFCCWPSSSLSSHASMFWVLCSLSSRFSFTYSSASALAASAAKAPVFDEKPRLSLVQMDGRIALDHHGDRRQHEDGDGDVAIPVDDREAVENVDVVVDREIGGWRPRRTGPACRTGGGRMMRRAVRRY